MRNGSSSKGILNPAWQDTAFPHTLSTIYSTWGWVNAMHTREHKEKSGVVLGDALDMNLLYPSEKEGLVWLTYGR